MGIPERPSESGWQELTPPGANPTRDVLMRNIDQQAGRMRALSPGFGSPLQAYMAGGNQDMGGLI